MKECCIRKLVLGDGREPVFIEQDYYTNKDGEQHRIHFRTYNEDLYLTSEEARKVAEYFVDCAEAVEEATSD